MSPRLLRPLQASLRSRAPLSRSIASRQFHTTRANMTVHHIESASAFKEALANNPVVFVDFFATWCPPCKAIAPSIDQWSDDAAHNGVYFSKIDVDAVPELAKEYSVRAMPTFLMFKDGEVVETFLGANPPKILEMIQKNLPA